MRHDPFSSFCPYLFAVETPAPAKKTRPRHLPGFFRAAEADASG
jgi:hypothetical protein